MMAGKTLAYETSKKKNVLFMTFGLLLILTNSLLMQQNRQLKAAINEEGRSLELSQGTYLPPIDGLDTEGKPLSLSYEGESLKTLLFIFSPGCKACRDNMRNWQTIRKQMDEKSVRVAAVSIFTEGTKQYVARYGLSDLTVMADVDAKDRASYKLALTPQTILISPEGRVERVWTGLLDADTMQQIVSAASPLAK
jgi:hypothetical protein